MNKKLPQVSMKYVPIQVFHPFYQLTKKWVWSLRNEEHTSNSSHDLSYHSYPYGGAGGVTCWKEYLELGVCSKTFIINYKAIVLIQYLSLSITIYWTLFYHVSVAHSNKPLRAICYSYLLCFYIYVVPKNTSLLW